MCARNWLSYAWNKKTALTEAHSRKNIVNINSSSKFLANEIKETQFSSFCYCFMSRNSGKDAIASLKVFRSPIRSYYILILMMIHFIFLFCPHLFSLQFVCTTGVRLLFSSHFHSIHILINKRFFLHLEFQVSTVSIISVANFHSLFKTTNIKIVRLPLSSVPSQWIRNNWNSVFC